MVLFAHTDGDPAPERFLGSYVLNKIREFLSAVAEDGTFEPSFEQGYKVQALLDAIVRADERGEWVSVE